MDLIKKNFLIFFILLLVLSHSFLKAEEEDVLIQAVADQIQVLTKDLKTLEKAERYALEIISFAFGSFITLEEMRNMYPPSLILIFCKSKQKPKNNWLW